MYNLDPTVTFWGTPRVHGVLRESVVHPGNLTFKLPDNVSFEEAVLVEPLTLGVHVARKVGIASGDNAIVTGAGPIGVIIALAALASGCSQVIITDVKQLISRRFAFEDSIKAFEYAASAPSDVIKIMIDM